MSADPHRVHARAVSLTVDEWVSLLGFPSTCATLGKRYPNWVRALCELADATGQAIPRTLLDALGRGDPHEKLADCESDAASMGERLGLCIVKGSPGPTVRILPTPFGFAVSFVSKVRAIEAHLSALDGTAWQTRIGVACPRRLSAALPRAASPILDHIESRAIPPSDDHDESRALPPGTDHEGRP